MYSQQIAGNANSIVHITSADRTKHRAHLWLKKWIELLIDVINISLICQTV